MYRCNLNFLKSDAGRAFLAAIAFLASALVTWPAEFKVSLDRSTIGLGESVNLNLVFENGTPRALSRPPTIPDLDFISGPSQNNEYKVFNGEAKQTFTVTYVIRPRKQGAFEIPAFEADVDNQRLKSQPVSFNVIEPLSSTGEAAMGNLAFLRLILPRTEVFVGETFPVELQIYVQQLQDPPRPQIIADGFSLGRMIQVPNASTIFNNQRFGVFVLRWSATAAKIGDLAFGPAECDLNLQIPVARTRRDPFDPFDMFGPTYQVRPAHLRTPTQTVKVLPLPGEGRPASFNGAVGEFTLTFSATPTNLAAGDPITARIAISGLGAVDSLVLPPQPQWQSFKSYPPTSTTELADETGTAGTKKFEQVLIPEDSTIKALPPLQFSFFNPSQKQYITLSSPEIPLTISPSMVVPLPALTTTNIAPPERPKIAADIIHIRPRLDGASGAGATWITQPWFVALQATPVLAWMALLVRRRRIEWRENNPRAVRRRELEQHVREGLNQMRDLAVRQDAELFFATLFRVLQEQLGERLDLPASAITADVIEDRLRPLGVDENVRTKLASLFEACDQARFAPQHSAGELAALIPQTEEVVRQLKEVAG